MHLATLTPTLMVALAALAQPTDSAAPAQPAAPLPPAERAPFPHPLITEIYYAVGPGPAGDSTGDGNRDANGDEFIELINPHDKPINLKGYTLSGKMPRRPDAGDGAPPKGRGTPPAKGKARGEGAPAAEPPADAASSDGFEQIKFTFPDVELKPQQIVVVFHGRGQSIPGPVGDAAAAPAEGNPKFNGALVFSMKITADKAGLGNQRDFVVLHDPAGAPVSAVKWGDIPGPRGVDAVDEAPVIRGQSVQRTGPGGAFEPHPDYGGKSFSPGVYPVKNAGW